ncbi:H-NS family nucleoid-associated regulatory protein [Paracoccus sp. PAMC 22219]|uniref:H-NS histone family protein n=1 Tax=Paracoccus sp. PAMC 22219 TaxID=1569209 RepID=UPI0005A87D11|nr:H-NS histone family protein [Paracoccus sp. PAMC 22219]
MSDFDFDTMSLDELKRLKRNLDKAIANFDDRRKAEARRNLEEKAREYGFSLSELADVKTTKRAAVAPKYRNPGNPEQTWSGRGRQPTWFRDAIEAGTEPNDLMI